MVLIKKKKKKKKKHDLLKPVLNNISQKNDYHTKKLEGQSYLLPGDFIYKNVSCAISEKILPW